jgi:hypothetical protein
MAGGYSYNGWPASDDPNAINIDRDYTVLGTVPYGSGGYAGGMKAGDISTVFTYLIEQLDARVEPMDSGGGGDGYGCWAYNYRANVNNPSSLSCHASGTAIDYNAPRHPNGTSTGPSGGGGWTAAQYYEVCEILDELQGALDWLTSNDPMHFEADVDAATMARIAATLPAGGGGNPEGDWLDMVSKEELQEMLDPILGAANRADWGVNDPNQGVRVQVAAVQNTVTDMQGRQIPGLTAQLSDVAADAQDMHDRQIPLVDGHVVGLYPPVGADAPDTLTADS